MSPAALWFSTGEKVEVSHRSESETKAGGKVGCGPDSAKGRHVSWVKPPDRIHGA